MGECSNRVRAICFFHYVHGGTEQSFVAEQMQASCKRHCCPQSKNHFFGNLFGDRELGVIGKAMEGKDKVRLSYDFLDRDRLKRSFEDVVDRTLRLGDGQSRACSLRRPEGQLGGAGTHFDFSAEEERNLVKDKNKG